MTLDELVAQMTNPQEFTRLCNSVFTDMYGDAFQVIDGTRGDNGNDGYVASERRILAIHCPIKPEQKTNAGYMEKIRGDLAKAATLKREKKYDIDAWTFITPRKLADDVIAAMRSLGEKAGIRASHQESTFLANELYRRSHLLKGFPGLQQLDLGAKIDQLIHALAAKQMAPTAEPTTEPKPQLQISDEAGEVRFLELTAGAPTQESKSALKALAYKTADPILEINAILALFRWYSPVDDNRRELLVFASRGVDRAKRCGLTDARAIFHAHKAALILWDFITSLIEARVAVIAGFIVPFSITPIEQGQERLTELRGLEQSWKAEAAAAMDLIKSSRDSDTVAGVLVVIGTNMGQLAQTYRNLGENSVADRYLAECKALLMAAKDVYAAAGDELGATNAVFNLANQVRWHGDNTTALDLVKSTIPVAEKHADLLLLQKAKWLQQTLETGEIPDYVAGERRAWNVASAHTG
jgi:hypothetical protein